MVRCVVEGGLSKAAAARQFNTTSKTVAKWVERFRADGVDGLRDRSSRPLSLPSTAIFAAIDDEPGGAGLPHFSDGDFPLPWHRWSL